MPDLKQELSELIDAYSIARATGNERLTRQSAAALIEFLESVEISKPENDGSQE